MAIKTILVPIDGSKESFAALDRAFVIADRFGSHIKALHIMLCTSGVAAAGYFTLPARLRKTADLEVDKVSMEKAAELQAEFEARCSDHNVPIGQLPGKQSGVTAVWHQESGPVEETLIHHGRASDVIAVTRPRIKENTLRRSPIGQATEAILLGTSRPVLIAPPEITVSKCERVAVGWNDSIECSRALAMTMPWLARMKQVTIILSKEREASVDTLVDYLAWHDVEAEIAFLDGKGKSTGDALLNVCSEIDAEFLIVGGFSRSRASQLLFGGVTYHLLTKANLVTIMVH